MGACPVNLVFQQNVLYQVGRVESKMLRLWSILVAPERRSLPGLGADFDRGQGPEKKLNLECLQT